MEYFEKKYKEALNWMREMYPCLTDSLKEDAEHYFPELAEGEDERIRKALLKYFSEPIEHESDAWLFEFGIENKDVIAYLEKQKEPKPNIELIQKSWYMEGYNDRKFSKEPKWVIKTGEGGPKYEENPKYGQMLEAEQNPAEFTHHETNESLKDAVTYQMEDDGDEYDFVRKGLDVIALKYAELGARWQKEQKPAHTAKEMWKEMRLEVYAQASGNRHEPNYSDDSTKMFSLCDIDEIFEKIGDSTVGTQPAEWSEKDEKMFDSIVNVLEVMPSANFIPIKRETMIHWLKSLLERFNLQPNWKPSEEQMDALEHFIRSWGESGTMSPQNPILCAAKSLYNNLLEL